MNEQRQNRDQPLRAARFIKEIGRGKDGARDLSRQDACSLFAAMLEQRVSDLELGAILLSMRIKGESIDELAGFMDALAPAMLKLQLPPGLTAAPVVIPSYNGARKKANLTPLLALLIAREGIPVLVHGIAEDPGRVTSAEIFQAMDLQLCQSSQEVSQRFAAGVPAMMELDYLSPALHRLLMLRRILGVRNSSHTLVKMLLPFDIPALRLYSYTHPEYLQSLGHYFSTHLNQTQGEVLMMRGTEGEVVANTGRAQQIDRFAQGVRETLLEKQELLTATEPELPEDIDATSTAVWIHKVLNQELPVPANIAEQVRLCVSISRRLHGLTANAVEYLAQ
ncbi:DNA-binding protein YbiB [Undibacterium sp. CY7W]|uniref:DNA-binding protein YbiB n=1 Tax=Undibacterium rugosum TaxID=2762291 RepID=A0A923KU72_9BURK|nr:DNA-binding protein YbiB [Undibacterium rugosum]MBC3936799.1 DNA-binding protein YbiB [Undibacterium rugosum]